MTWAVPRIAIGLEGMTRERLACAIISCVELRYRLVHYKRIGLSMFDPSPSISQMQTAMSTTQSRKDRREARAARSAEPGEGNKSRAGKGTKWGLRCDSWGGAVTNKRCLVQPEGRGENRNRDSGCSSEEEEDIYGPPTKVTASRDTENEQDSSGSANNEVDGGVGHQGMDTVRETRGAVEVTDVEVDSTCNTAQSSLSKTIGYYNAEEAGEHMKRDNMRLERHLGLFVAEKIFPDMKFTIGDVQAEKSICLLAVQTDSVRLGDDRIDPSLFADKYFDKVSPKISRLRTNAHNQAKLKFQGEPWWFRMLCFYILSNIGLSNLVTEQFKKDRCCENEAEKVLPPSLGVLLDSNYRDYLDDGGTVKEDRKEQYECFVWFTQNVLSSVNYEVTSRKRKEAESKGSQDYITKAYSPTDEAYAIMLVLNYEKRWRNQVIYPTKDRKLLNRDEKYTTKYTSSTKGFCKLSWAGDGVEEYNKWVTRVIKLREETRTGKLLEAKVKETIEGRSKKRKRRKTEEVIRHVPTMGSGLQAQLAAIAQNKTSV